MSAITVVNPTIDKSAPSGAQLARMEAYISAHFLSKSQDSRNRYNDAFWMGYFQGNPARFSQRIFAEHSSSSTANGFVYIQDAPFYDFVDEMVATDTNISAALSLMVADVLGREDGFEPVDPDDPEQVEIAEACNRYLINSDLTFGWDDLKTNLIIGMETHGFSTVEILWKRIYDNGRKWIVPRNFMHRHPGQFCFDEEGRQYFYDPDESDFTKNPVENFKFITLRAPALYGNPYGKSDVYDLRHLYWFKKEATKAWIVYCDTYGFPLLKGRIGTDGVIVDEVTRYQEMLTTIIQNAQPTSGVVLLPGMDIEAMARDAGQGVSPHAVLTDWVNREETRYLMGATLPTMEAEFGARAMAKTQQDTSKSKLKPLTGSLRTCLQRDAVNSFVYLNYGSTAIPPRYKADMNDGISFDQAIRVLDTYTRNRMDIGESWVRGKLKAPKPSKGAELVKGPKAPMAGGKSSDKGELKDGDGDGVVNEPEEGSE